METAMHHRSKPAAMHWALFKKIFASETSVSVQLFKKGLRPPQSSVTHWNGLKLHIDQAPLQICKFALGVTSSLKHPDASLLNGAFSSATGSILHQPLQHAQLQGLCLSGGPCIKPQIPITSTKKEVERVTVVKFASSDCDENIACFESLKGSKPR